MSRTISEVFDLPSREELTALAFVVQMRDDGEVDRMIRDYVVTPTVADELPIILKAMRHTQDRREELGRFVHGSFGSGKSHFMSYLGLLLENDDRAWAKADATVQKLASEQRPWLASAKLLVVRLHMLTVGGGQEKGLDRAVYEATNAALERRGKPRFEFLHVDGVIDEARREAELYGAAFWKRLAEAGIVGSREDFEAMAQGDAEERESLAREYLKWKGRDASTAGVDPDWADGLRRLCDHVREQGYGGVVFLVDEFLLWLREKNKQGFERAINELNVMVDHGGSPRSLPLFVFVAQQRNIEEFFPDLTEEKETHERIGHISKRFEKTDLEDVELRFVCKGRVLRVKPAFVDEVERVRASLAEKHQKLLPSVLQTAGLDYLKDVYPFHPALIEMLVDVSALMQRDRTALRLLYELLVIQHPTLAVGDLLPVGAAFDALFPEAGIEGSKKVDELRSIHRTYHQQFKRAMEAMVKQATESGGDFDEARRRVLEMIVKTALLAEISPRLKGTTAMTVERLVRLNDAEIDGETERSKTSRVYADLSELARLVPGVIQLSGQGAQATVGVVFSKVNFGEILNRARADVSGHKNPLLNAFYGVLLPELKLGRDDLNDTQPIEWRKTKRKAFVGVRNIRELSNAEFRTQPGEDVRILIDYPWDVEPYTPGDDEQRALDVRRRDGACSTICWLPRHFTPNEKALVEDLAALDHLAGPAHDDYLRDLAPHERAAVLDQAQSQAANLRQNLKGRLGEVYRDHGKLVALRDGVDRKVPGGELHAVLDKLPGLLLEKQYPGHPTFQAEPKADALNLMCEFAARAIASPDNGATYTDDEVRVLKTLGTPLELVEVGQARATLRLDTRYIKTVRDEARGESVRWEAIDSKLADTYGLPIVVRNFFLKLLLVLESFRAVESGSGDPIENIAIDGKSRSNVTLVRALLLDLAEWSRARELADELLGVKTPMTTRTLTAQDRLAKGAREAAHRVRSSLQDVCTPVVRLGLEGSARDKAVRDAQDRLAPLIKDGADSCAALRAWMKLWPAESNDLGQRTVQQAAAMAAGLAALNQHEWQRLKTASADALGGDVANHVAALEALLASPERDLDEKAIKAWNQTAHDLVGRLLQQKIATPPEPAPPPAPGAMRIQRRVRAGDAGALDTVWREVRSKAQELGPDAEVTLDVTITPKRS